MTDNADETPDVVTPTHGNMDQKQHTAFLLRIMVYLIEQQPNKTLTVDLEKVLKETKGRQMQVRLDGPVFEARTIPDLIHMPTPEELANIGKGK